MVVDLISISFDYASGYANDAVDIRFDADTDIIPPEYYPQYGKNYPFAYIAGQTNRKIKVYFWHNQGLGVICNIHVKTTGSGFYPGLVQESIVDFFDPTIWRCGSYSRPAILTLTGGSVSNSIQHWGFCLNWYVTKVNGETLLTQKYIGTTGDHRHYILLAEPQSPMTVPWTDVLDYSCSWAVSRTSTTAAASAITNSLFNSGFKYDVDGGGGSHYSNGWTQFDLTSFTSDLGSSKLVNCLDMGKAVTTFSNAVGCGLGLCTYGWTTYGEYQIDGPLNCIDPIGTPSPTNNPFGYPIIDDDCRISGFSYHAFSEKISNFNVWDATLRYDIDTNPDNVSGSNPGCGFTTTGYSWKLPADEIESTYISRLIDSWPEFYYSTPTLRRNRSLSVY